MKIGLVLSGGGAKGAYQAGVVKALAELDTQVDMVAGASIGALNAAILASSSSLKEGAEKMEELWMTLAISPPLAPNFPAYLHLLISAGMRFNGIPKLNKIIGTAISKSLPIPHFFQNILKGMLLDQTFKTGLLSDDPLHLLMEKHFNPELLSKGIPLYCSVFKSSDPLQDILSVIAADIGLIDSPSSEFIHIQSLPADQQKEALLASAAIPLLFAPKRINDTIYHDGGMGGWQKMQGNTPITPLLQQGIRHIIVTHLSDGSLWSRHDFPDATVLEIRPQSSIQRDSEIKDILGFDQKKIPSWIEQGYEDTLHCVGRVMQASSVRNELRVSETALMKSKDFFDGLDQDLLQSLQRLE